MHICRICAFQVDLPLEIPPFGKAVAGAVVSNINEPTVMATKLRRTTTVGVALRGEQSVATVEVANPFSDPGPKREVRAGYELALVQNLVGRVGYITEGKILTFGFSYRSGSVAVDYGLASVTSDQNVNLLSASMRF